MNCSTHPRREPTLLLSVLLGGVLLTSCSSGGGNQASAPMPMSSPNAEAPADNRPRQLANDAAATSEETEATQVPRSRPQLIKKAELTLTVDSVDKTIQAVSAIVNKQQGDLLGLEDQKPKDGIARQTASIQIRIPQNLLEPTLDQLAKLGTAQSRTITAEDVGNQLVDYQARLTNLRKTESSLLKIMDRAGSMGDVLRVAQELSNVRQSIEQISAQLKSLQNQVAYSTITLKLEALTSATTPQPPLGSRVQETWDKSTHSFSEFTISLLRLGIWLMVYSPYLLVLGAAAYGYTRLRRPPSRSLKAPEPPNAD